MIRVNSRVPFHFLPVSRFLIRVQDAFAPELITRTKDCDSYFNSYVSSS